MLPTTLRPSRRPLVLALVTALLAGCTSAPGAAEEPAAPASELRAGDALFHSDGQRGAFSLLHLAEGGPAKVAFPEGVLVLGDDGRLTPPAGPLALADGEAVRYLPPYAATTLAVEVQAGGATTTLDLALAPGPAFAPGERVVELLKEQRDSFPHRTPGHPSYDRAIAHFAQAFAALGYEVEVFATPLPDVQVPVSPAPGTASVKSVVATKRGIEQPDRYLAFGGHFDVVEETTHGALDNTGGTMSVFALAESLAKVNTSRSILFAAWGGEEDGILGSQVWLAAHPEMVAAIDLYVNYDVSGLSWPAPLGDPARVLVATGPDGPVSEALAAQHRTVAATYLGLGEDVFVYEPVAQGQAVGAGVNAQSDHTPFMSRGIPVVFQFTERVDDVLPLIHSEDDTVENLARYALLGPEGIGLELDAAEMAAAEDALARSFETQLASGLYLALLADAGALPSTRPASLPPVSALANTRS